MQNSEIKIPPLPASWPQDRRARIRTTPDGRIYAVHPARESVELIGGKWCSRAQAATPLPTNDTATKDAQHA